MPLGGVFVLLCAASSKVHPAMVISVLYPVAGGETTGSAGEGGSGLVGRGWRRQRHRKLIAVHIFLLVQYDGNVLLWMTHADLFCLSLNKTSELSRSPSHTVLIHSDRESREGGQGGGGGGMERWREERERARGRQEMPDGGTKAQREWRHIYRWMDGCWEDGYNKTRSEIKTRGMFCV